MNKNIEILKKFIGEQNQRIQNDISKQGYKDDSPYRNNPFNIIQGTPQGTPITMKGVSTPLIGVDEYGNMQKMHPGQEYYYPGSQVKETPAEGAGAYGSHYISNKGNYVFPNLQDNGEGILKFIPNAASSDREAMRFENPDEADYFAKNYKKVALMTKYKKQYGGVKIKDERDLTFAKKDVIPNFQPKIGIPLTAKQIEQKRVQELIDKQGTIKSYTPQSTVSRVSEVALNPLTAFGYAARNESLPENFSRGQRNALDSAVDIVNPAFYLNQGAKAVSNTSNAINNVAQGNLPAAYRDIKNAGMNTLNVLPLISEYKTLGRVANNIGKVLGTEEGLLNNLSKTKTLNELKGSLVGIPPEKALPRLSSEELKIYRQVQDIGRMRATGKPISQQYKYALEQGIPEEHLQQIFNKSKSEIENIIPAAQEEEAFRLANPIRDRLNLERSPRTTSSDQIIDVINNSMPQQNRSDIIRHTLSDYGSDSDIDMEQLLERVSNNQLPPIPEEFILNTGSTTRGRRLIPTRGRILIPGQRSEMTLGERFNTKNNNIQKDIYNTVQSFKNKIAVNSQNYPYYNGPVLENVPSLSLSGSGSLKNVSNKVTGQSVSGINSGDIFTGSLNTSHSSYLPQLKQIFKYDEGLPQFLGYKPMNSMGFLSDYNYSSKDIAKYLNTEIDTQISRGIIPKDIQRPYVKGDKVLLPHYAIKQKKTGGSIQKENYVPAWLQ